MAIYTYDILSYGLEQGTISGTQDEPSDTRIRNVDFIPLDSSPKTVVVTALSNSKICDVNFLGYGTDNPESVICDLYWYESPHTFDLSSYNGINYARVVLKYSDNSNITPSEIVSVSLVLDDEKWTVEDNRLTYNGLPSPIENIMSEPYPPFWWYVSNGRLTHTGLPSPIDTGAFYGCSQLKKVHIPESVKYIGEFAFAETALTSVRIAADCFYYDTSFPDDCDIRFYSDYGEYTGAVPVRFHSDGNNLADWAISGNTGGTGDRTANLFDKSTVVRGKRVVVAGEITEENAAHTDYINISGASEIAVNLKLAATNLYFYDENKSVISYSNSRTAVVPDGTVYVRANINIEDIDAFMLNIGGSPLPYEPYGYKIPVVCGGAVTNIYMDSPLGTGKSISRTSTGVEIPTVDGINTLTVSTAVQPSQVYIKYSMKGG